MSMTGSMSASAFSAWPCERKSAARLIPCGSGNSIFAIAETSWPTSPALPATSILPMIMSPLRRKPCRLDRWPDFKVIVCAELDTERAKPRASRTSAPGATELLVPQFRHIVEIRVFPSSSLLPHSFEFLPRFLRLRRTSRASRSAAARDTCSRLPGFCRVFRSFPHCADTPSRPTEGTSGSRRKRVGNTRSLPPSVPWRASISPNEKTLNAVASPRHSRTAAICSKTLRASSSLPIASNVLALPTCDLFQLLSRGDVVGSIREVAQRFRMIVLLKRDFAEPIVGEIDAIRSSETHPSIAGRNRAPHRASAARADGQPRVRASIGLRSSGLNFSAICAMFFSSSAGWRRSRASSAFANKMRARAVG